MFAFPRASLDRTGSREPCYATGKEGLHEIQTVIRAHTIFSFPMAGLCYSKTFIDEEMPSPFTGRARSCPPIMTKAEKPDALNLCCLHSEEMQLKLQVSKLQQRSEPCIRFVRGRCEMAENCGFCHLAHVLKPPAFDKPQREFLKNLPAVDFMEVILPHIRKQVEESEVPGADVLLQLLESEISIRGQPQRGQPQRPPRKIRYVLERMTLAGLVSLACSTLPGRFLPNSCIMN
eukprot:symbB.v1.2.032709.t1/scaffold3962.1/size79057/3